MFYEFKCEAHGNFDEFQGMQEEHVANCPVCKEPAARVFFALRHTIDFVAGYDHGLGQHVNSAAERDNAVDKLNLRRIRG